MEVAVDIFTGFLESGKTSLIMDAMENSDFAEDDMTLLIVCEEGEEEYDDEQLEDLGVTKYVIDEEEQLNENFLQGLELNYHPDHVLIEYNGTWEMAKIMEMNWPAGWEVTGIYSTVDAATAETYLTNMRTMFLEQLICSDLVIVNRTTGQTDRAKIRRSIKMMNPRAQVVFEKENGEEAEQTEEDLPFDLNAPVIEIDEIDYGIWYIDALEHPGHYIGKDIRFLAQVYTSDKLGKNAFVPGRFVMTCCEEDIRFLGYLCRTKAPVPFEKRDWVTVTVKFDIQHDRKRNEDVPALTLMKIEKAEKPLHDVVTFN